MILSYTPEIQKAIGSKVKPEPWLHIVYQYAENTKKALIYAIYVWDTREVIGTDLINPKERIKLAKPVPDSKENLKGDNYLIDYLNMTFFKGQSIIRIASDNRGKGDYAVVRLAKEGGGHIGTRKHKDGSFGNIVHTGLPKDIAEYIVNIESVDPVNISTEKKYKVIKMSDITE